MNLKNRSLYVAWVWSACYYGVLITDQAAYANVLIKCSSCRARKRNADATYKSLSQTLLHRAICMREVAEKFCVDHWGKEIGIFQLLNEIMTLSLREYQKTLKTKDCKSRFSCACLQGVRKSRAFALLPALTSVMFFLEFYASHVEKTLVEEQETYPWSVKLVIANTFNEVVI